MKWRHEEGTEGMGFESEWITNLWTKEEEGTDVTDLTIIGNAIPQHMNQNIPKKDKKRDPVFGGQEFATECSCFFPFSEVENMQFFWVK
jgi:hypothetical protein